MNDSKENKVELISKLMEQLTSLKEEEEKQVSVPHVMFDDDIEVEAGPGTPIKIDSKTYYRMIYADVSNLKKDTESLVQLYLDDVKPTLKSVDENVKILSTNFKKIEEKIAEMERNKPRTFKMWLDEKGKIADNVGSLGKIVFWTIVILWMLSTALPNVLSFIAKMSGFN